jgi:hypothetical protein
MQSKQKIHQMKRDELKQIYEEACMGKGCAHVQKV